MQEADALLPGHGDAAFLVAVQVAHVDIPVDQLQQCGLAAAVAAYHGFCPSVLGLTGFPLTVWQIQSESISVSAPSLSSIPKVIA